MSDLSDLHSWQPPDDSEAANRWRGDLFPSDAWNLSQVMWRDKNAGVYKTIPKPGYVAFPICYFCGRIVWTWPHFEEPVPDGACCDGCAASIDEDAERDRRA
jgi:hypothetical protein